MEQTDLMLWPRCMSMLDSNGITFLLFFRVFFLSLIKSLRFAFLRRSLCQWFLPDLVLSFSCSKNLKKNKKKTTQNTIAFCVLLWAKIYWICSPFSNSLAPYISEIIILLEHCSYISLIYNLYNAVRRNQSCGRKAV